MDWITDDATPHCHACGHEMVLKNLLATDSKNDDDLKLFWFCDNLDCVRGPTIIRSLKETS